jgi:hypothetical protein
MIKAPDITPVPEVPPDPSWDLIPFFSDLFKDILVPALIFFPALKSKFARPE